ncbi:MAG: MBL fold metallo-hydrolase [Actinobacteria bacterium]|nr:MBL fold metallo-hydrolase [Actinomycetota bacterium]MBM3711987.1 MBL fold metallo-hydrolase [Actinomycetota bacterium]
MIFKQIESGGDRNYAYLFACEKTKEGALVDPSPDPFKVLKAAKKEGVEIKYVINTHSHFDHSGGNNHFRDIDGNKPVTFINCGAGTEISDGEVIKLGELKLEFINTPGHTPDSICIKVQDKLITGDTLFVGKIGGTYGEKDARAEFKSLKKIMTLPHDTEVWPGHDYGVKPYSTIGYELKSNPFIKRLNNFSEFLRLKQNWIAYKKEHGIK